MPVAIARNFNWSQANPALPHHPKENMNWSLTILLANVVSTLFLVGLIWMVQVVHYPLFDDVGEPNYVSYQQRHQTSITYIVGPMMTKAMKPDWTFPKRWYEEGFIAKADSIRELAQDIGINPNNLEQTAQTKKIPLIVKEKINSFNLLVATSGELVFVTDIKTNPLTAFYIK